MRRLSSSSRSLLAFALALATGTLFSLGAARAEEPLPDPAPPAPAPEEPKGEAPEAAAEKPAPPPIAPIAKIVVGIPHAVRGALPKAAASSLASVGPAIEACYREAIAAEGEGEGSIELRLELVGPGRVASATVNASLGLSSRLRGCVRDTFAGVPVSSIGPEPVEALLSIVFDRDVPEDATRPTSACAESCEGEMTDELRVAIRERAARAGFCFKRAAAPGEPSTLKAGTMNVLLRLAGDGSVCGVAVSNDGFGRPSLTSCVVEAMSAAMPVQPSGCIDVSVPIVFKGT